jgi:hypothetical protein
VIFFVCQLAYIRIRITVQKSAQYHIFSANHFLLAFHTQTFLMAPAGLTELQTYTLFLVAEIIAISMVRNTTLNGRKERKSRYGMTLET